MDTTSSNSHVPQLHTNTTNSTRYLFGNKFRNLTVYGKNMPKTQETVFLSRNRDLSKNFNRLYFPNPEITKRKNPLCKCSSYQQIRNYRINWFSRLYPFVSKWNRNPNFMWKNWFFNYPRKWTLSNTAKSEVQPLLFLEIKIVPVLVQQTIKEIRIENIPLD